MTRGTRDARYEATDKGRERRNRYDRSDKGLARQPATATHSQEPSQVSAMRRIGGGLGDRLRA